MPKNQTAIASIGNFRAGKIEFKRAFDAGDYNKAHDLQKALWSADNPLRCRHVRDIPLLPLDRELRSGNHECFVFVSGVPRSGTTAMGRLLNQSSQVAIYTELYSQRFGYEPRMLDPDNADKLYQLQCLPSLARYKNRMVHKRSYDARFIGDKRPNFMHSGVYTAQHFSAKQLTVVHMVRNIFDIVRSYLASVTREAFPESFGVEMAVKHANENNMGAVSFRQQLAPHHRLLVVKFDKFWADPTAFELLSDRIGLDRALTNDRAIAPIYSKSQRVLAKKSDLDAGAAEYIEKNYDFKLEADVLSGAVVA